MSGGEAAGGGGTSEVESYYRAVAARPPTPLLVRATAELGAASRALDLGAGAGADARYLLERGFRVTAVDADPRAEPLLRDLPHQERLTIVTGRFEDFEPEQYELVYSFMSLFFLGRRAFGEVWGRLLRSLAPGGVLDDGGTFLAGEELGELALGLEVVSLRDEEPELRMWNQGVRRKHVLELVARRSRQLAGPGLPGHR